MTIFRDFVDYLQYISNYGTCGHAIFNLNYKNNNGNNNKNNKKKRKKKKK